MSAVPQVSQMSGAWQAGFLNILPTIKDHAEFKFRRLRAEEREEAVHEAIASACVSYQILAAKGRLDAANTTTLGDFAVKFVRNGRHVGGKQDAAKDVMSPLCHRRHGVDVVSYHAKATASGCGTVGWQQIAIAERKASIPDTAAFRIDFPNWLKTLTHRDRKIIVAFIAGDSTSTVANRFSVSPGRVSQLRRRFQHLWRTFHGETMRDAA